MDGYAGDRVSLAFCIKGYSFRVLFLNEESNCFSSLLMPFCLCVAFFFHAVLALLGVSNFVYRYGCVCTIPLHVCDFAAFNLQLHEILPAGFWIFFV
ncbi:hypothetical protein D3C77_539470 [compost metagenome]